MISSDKNSLLKSNNQEDQSKKDNTLLAAKTVSAFQSLRAPSTLKIQTLNVTLSI